MSEDQRPAKSAITPTFRLGGQFINARMVNMHSTIGSTKENFSAESITRPSIRCTLAIVATDYWGRIWASLSAAARRESITIQVEAGRSGEPMMFRSPTDGIKIECNERQAQEIHMQCPLVLREVIAHDIAIFSPAQPYFDVDPPLTLPCPPFDMLGPENTKATPDG